MAIRGDEYRISIECRVCKAIRVYTKDYDGRGGKG